MQTITMKSKNGEIINSNVHYDLAASLVNTGECVVHHDPAYYPLLVNAEPGVIYKN
jgi:hypothetical protein